MTRKEYFEKLRSVILELSDHEIGVYILHIMTPYVTYRTEIPNSLNLSYIELNNRLFPIHFNENDWNEKVGGNPTLEMIKNSLRSISFKFSSKREKERYESAVLATGQNVRGLLTGDPVARWNLLYEKINELEPRYRNAEEYAIRWEASAKEQRQTANDLKFQLENLKKELEEIKV